MTNDKPKLSQSSIPIKAIRFDIDILIAKHLNYKTVRKYLALMQKGRPVPPIRIYWDGQNFWLIDGFHRIYAARTLGRKEIRCETYIGTQEEALQEIARMGNTPKCIDRQESVSMKGRMTYERRSPYF